MEQGNLFCIKRKSNICNLLYVLITAMLSLCFPGKIASQTDSNVVLNFNFNEHQIKEVDDKLIIKPVGITLTADRYENFTGYLKFTEIQEAV